MNDIDKNAGTPVAKYAVTVMVIAVIVAVAYLAYFSPGRVDPDPNAPAVREGGQEP